MVWDLLTCFGGVSICMCHFWTGTCSVILSNMLLKSSHTFNFMSFVCFSKSSNCIQSLLRGSYNFELLYEKPTCANFFQIELKVVWLPILSKQLPLMLALTEINKKKDNNNKSIPWQQPQNSRWHLYTSPRSFSSHQLLLLKKMATIVWDKCSYNFSMSLKQYLALFLHSRQDTTHLFHQYKIRPKGGDYGTWRISALVEIQATLFPTKQPHCTCSCCIFSPGWNSISTT